MQLKFINYSNVYVCILPNGIKHVIFYTYTTFKDFSASFEKKYCYPIL